MDRSKSVEVKQEIETWELDDPTWARIGGRDLGNGVAEPGTHRYHEP
ncbi:hypothetical protein RV134_210166 [Roseovarius sp. EC-HK134]|nr:hypothetical protein RV134_210166 [Roseovarius sp. EC-HK134]VVT01633.1 hypothetical protein RV420_260031 [Roseovarius sp. EC-SD190]